MPRLTLAALALAAVLIAPAQAVAAKKKPYRAEIRRTTGGVPHIKARDYGSMGFGYGYAYAQDQLCEMADIVVTVNAQRSRYFGAANAAPTGTNLESDFFYQRIKDQKTVEKLSRRASKVVRDTVTGFTAGYNAYLKKTGRAKLPDPTCRGKAWVRPIKPIDLYRRYYQLGLRASSGNFLKEIVAAAPPQAGAARAAALPSAEEVRAGLADDPVLGEEHPLGSNAYGIGSQGARGVRSLVLGNPHFPWQGSERWYEVHLTVPGKFDAIGAALQGVPAVNIGFNKHVAWSHTVSTARRFTPYELKLVPGDPTSYLVDGKPVKMTQRTVRVAGQSHTFYETRWGPVLSYPAATLTWGTDTAYALGDVNANNFRLLQQWFEYDRAKSVAGMRKAGAKVQGNPWVNVIAADSKGRAYYADDSVVPNVDPAKQAACSTGAKAELLLSAGNVILLDGSRSACKWGDDADAKAKGILGPKALPRATRRDYVENSNDSYWLPSARFRISGFPRIIGAEGTQRIPRTRLGLIQAEQRLAGTDGLGPKGFTLNTLQKVFTGNRNLTAELGKAAVVQACQARGGADLAQACAVLAAWNGRADVDARGAVLWREFWTQLNTLGVPWLTPFDANDPVNTPRDLDGGSEKITTALSNAVADLRSKNIALDVPLGELQAEPRGAQRIAIPGCTESEGCFNIISTRRDAAGRYDPYTGSSFVMTAGFDKKGKPFGQSILSYSQSENPRSPHYDDQTKLFSQEKFLPMRFTDKQIKRDPDYSRRVVKAKRG